VPYIRRVPVKSWKTAPLQVATCPPLLVHFAVHPVSVQILCSTLLWRAGAAGLHLSWPAEGRCLLQRTGTAMDGMIWKKTRRRRHRRQSSVTVSMLAHRLCLSFIIVWFHGAQAASRFESSPILPTSQRATAGLGLCRGGDAAVTLPEGNQQNQSLAAPESIENEADIVHKRRRRWFGRDSEQNAVVTATIHNRRKWFGGIFDTAWNRTVRQHNVTALLATKSSGATAELAETNVSLTTKCAATTSSTSVVPTTSRGGALVKELPRQKRIWLHSPPTSKLVEESVKSVKTVWWVNTWLEQLPTASDEEEMLRQQAANAAAAAAALAKEKAGQLDRPSYSNATSANHTVAMKVTESVPLLVSVNATVSNKGKTKPILGPAAGASKKVQEMEKGTAKQKKQTSEPVPTKKGPDPTPTNSSQQPRPAKHKRKTFLTVPLPSNMAAVAPMGAYLSSGYVSQASDRVGRHPFLCSPRLTR
jgi:hypothetical protein